MHSINLDTTSPLVGIAHSEYINHFIDNHGDLFDYVEVPFELLMHNPSVFDITEKKPIILHCASLSIAGNVPPSQQTKKDIQYWVNKTQTPWIGEHLSFVTAPSAESAKYADEYAPGQPYNIGYTMPPPLNEEALTTVKQSVEIAEHTFTKPIILENPPIYFRIPHSEMDQVTFINRVVEETNVGILLDLAHFYITSQNEGFDPLERIDYFPLESVVEIHLSGVEEQEGIVWDHHASTAPDILYRLLQKVLQRATPKAITLEYNWNAKFPATWLTKEIQKVRAVVNDFQYEKE